MNGSYYQNPTFPQNEINYQNEQITPAGNVSSMSIISNEQSYIENILRLNKGKRVDIYMSYPDSNEWRDKIYTGIIEEAGKDHLIISNPSNNEWYLLRMIYLNYVEFKEKINYSHNYSEINY